MRSNASQKSWERNCVQQTYLGTAERLAAVVKEHTAPLPLSATTRDFGLPGALWRAAQDSGVWKVLGALWPPPRSGPSTAHYLLLAAIHRICQPGPQTEVADWYRSTILQPLWTFPPEPRRKVCRQVKPNFTRFHAYLDLSPPPSCSSSALKNAIAWSHRTALGAGGLFFGAPTI